MIQVQVDTSEYPWERIPSASDNWPLLSTCHTDTSIDGVERENESWVSKGDENESELLTEEKTEKGADEKWRDSKMKDGNNWTTWKETDGDTFSSIFSVSPFPLHTSSSFLKNYSSSCSFRSFRFIGEMSTQVEERIMNTQKDTGYTHIEEKYKWTNFFDHHSSLSLSGQ